MNAESAKENEDLTEQEAQNQGSGQDSSSEELTDNVCLGPGPLLCEAREHLGLNRAKVGQELGLTETAVKKLEKNHFDRFPNSVYVRGYLKNYAKILGKSESAIIEIYDRFCAENNLESGKSTLEPVSKKKRLGTGVKMSIGIALCAICATFFIFFSP